MSAFATQLMRWQVKHGRSGLPWQGVRDPYRVWLSEIMLQQTRVSAVIPYYERFLARFPDVARLASAPEDAVLELWSGLGYYSRARNLHAAARQVVAAHGGEFPRSRAALESLPGIGRSTAAAIAAFAFGAREAILDGNVKRVLARHFAVAGYPGDKPVEQALWVLAESLLPKKDLGIYTQAVMDLGATVCHRSTPDCARCPVAPTCAARVQGQVSQYPKPRPRKAVPVRSSAMLLLLDQGEVMLEKRPAPGIWGGLWCFPEMPERGDATDHCASRFGLGVSRVESLAALRHGFTHFTLNIHPLVCHVERRSPHAAEPSRIWLPLEQAARSAIPVPVKKLLAQLRASL